PPTTDISTLSLHDALPIWCRRLLAVLDHAILIDDEGRAGSGVANSGEHRKDHVVLFDRFFVEIAGESEINIFLLRPGFLSERSIDRKSTRLNSSHLVISYA